MKNKRNITVFIITIFIFFSINIIQAERYEPAIGKSGSVIDKGNIRFLFGWAYNELRSTENSKFDFGIDFGIGESVEWQNRIDYNSANQGDYQWLGWTEILKFRLSEVDMGPAYSLGLGARIPVRKSESLGLLAGLYVSSAIKDIDFDFNLGFNPYITKREVTSDDGETTKIRPNHFVNIDLILGYKLLPFLKINGGFESRQYLKNDDNDGGSSWLFLIGARIKPIDYPVLFDGNISAGSGNMRSYFGYDWQFRLGVQILPSSPNAEW